MRRKRVADSFIEALVMAGTAERSADPGLDEKKDYSPLLS